MKYRRVGRSGLKISEISLGAWLTYGRSVEDKDAVAIIQKALEAGINFIDIADIYAKGKAETVVGKAIKGITRSDLVISSKVFWPMSDNVNDRGLSRKHIMESIDKSLKRIGTDYLDIYFCHRWDDDTEVEETVRAMDDLIRQGKILYWGTSIWEAFQIERAVGEARHWGCHPPAVEQPRYNMLDRHIEQAVMPTCERYGMGLVVWSPLAQGLLTGKYNEGTRPKSSRADTTQFLDKALNEDNLDRSRTLTKMASDMGIKPSQLALAWILRRPEVSCAITGATTVEQLEENVIATEVKLTDSDLEAIEDVLAS